MRPSRPLYLALGFALLVSAQPMAANEPIILQPQPTGRANPFGRLFNAPGITKMPGRRVSAPQPQTSEPRVVCGTTVIPIDPNVDPGIYVEPQRGSTRYSIKAIPPPVCK